jgi:hypothetical protein
MHIEQLAATTQTTKHPAVPGTISRKTCDSTAKFNGQKPLDTAIANALDLLRGQVLFFSTPWQGAPKTKEGKKKRRT